ncbi:MAG: CBS domain-containing protein [Candidatus Electryonea clarkiae]|nr:CBS domain-containing protein [Candidatus Electryonea clarkiae]
MKSTLSNNDHDYTTMERHKKVKDLMLSLDEFGIVDSDATMMDALRVFRELQEHVPSSHNPQHAVLVRDRQGKIVGKLGQFAISKAFIEEDHYLINSHNDRINNTNICGENIRFYVELIHENINLICQHMRKIKVKDAMIPETASIDVNATLFKALGEFVNTRSLSLLVSYGGEVIGLLLLADVVDELSEYILRSV